MLTKILWIAMGAVFLTLVIGLITMVRGKDSYLSNRLMQLRVALQVIALLLFGYLAWSSHG